MIFHRRAASAWRVPRRLALLALLCALPGAAQIDADKSVRNVRGTISDPRHEPVRNAVVQLRNGNTNQVVTYITGNSGQYIFKRLDSHTDFQVWVLFRGHRSATRNISMFDSRLDDVINFTVRAY